MQERWKSPRIFVEKLGMIYADSVNTKALWWYNLSRQKSDRVKVELTHIEKLMFVALRFSVQRCWGCIIECLMQPLMIVKIKIGLKSLTNVLHTLIIMQINLFILHRAPQAFDKDIVQGTPSTIPTDANVILSFDTYIGSDTGLGISCSIEY